MNNKFIIYIKFMTKPKENIVKDFTSDLILSIDDEKSERISEDTKLKMAVMKESKDRKKNNKVINDKIDNFILFVGQQIEDLKNSYENALNNNVYTMANELNHMNNKLNENRSVVQLEEISKSRSAISEIEMEITDIRNKLLIEQKKLQENKSLESEIVNEIIYNKQTNLDQIISSIQKEIFVNEQNIDFFSKKIEEKTNEIKNLEETNDDVKEESLNIKDQIENFNLIKKSYFEFKEKYSNNIVNLKDKKIFTKNILTAFNNIKLSSSQSKTLEDIRDRYEEIIIEYNLDELFVKSNFDQIDSLINEIDLIKNNNKVINNNDSLLITKNMKKINELFSNSSKYFNQSEKLNEDLKKINFNLENLFESIIKYQSGDEEEKVKEEKVIDSVKKDFYNIMETEVKKIIPEDLENARDKFVIDKFYSNSEPVNNSVKVDVNRAYQVFILNCKSENDVINLNFGSLDEYKHELNNDMVSMGNLNEYISTSPDIKDIKFKDFLFGKKSIEKVVGKIVNHQSFYQDIKIKGDGIQNLDLYYNSNKKMSIKTNIEKMFQFETVRVISESQARLIITNIYGKDNFDLEFCYYCSKSSNFLIPAYHVKFKDGNFLETYFPANLNYLPKLRLNSISIESVSGKVNQHNYKTNDPDNIGNSSELKEKFIEFKIKLEDLVFSGDFINVYSSYKIDSKLSTSNEVYIKIPNILSKSKYNKLSNINLIISCKNKFGFINCLKLNLDLSKYSKMFQVRKGIDNGGNRHNYAINNFDSITGSEIFTQLRQDMSISGVKEEYCEFSPNNINGNADLIINIAGSENISEIIDNLDDVEHMLVFGKTQLSIENLNSIFDKKIHLLCGFEQNTSISDNLNKFYKNSYQKGLSLSNSWLLSCFISNTFESNPYVVGPIVANKGSKYNSLVSCYTDFYRAFLQDTVWGTYPGPGADLFNTKIEGFWKLIIE